MILPGPIETTTLYVYILIAIGVFVSAAVMAWTLVWAMKQPPPAALVTALSMLTLYAIVGGMISTNDEAWTIAAAGMGGIAASVTSVFQDKRFMELHKALEEAPPPSQEPLEDDLG